MGVFFAVAMVYVATATPGSNSSSDTITASIAAWVLAIHHTVNLAHLAIARATPPVLWAVPGAHGWLVSNRFPGAVLLAVPFYAVGGAAYSAIPGMAAAALAAAGAAAILYMILRRLQDRRVALAGTLLFAFATSNWTVSGHEIWEHSGSSLLIAAGMLGLLGRRWMWAGLALGATVLFRPHLGIAVAVICLGLLWMERRWRPAVLVGLGAAPGVVAYLTWNWFVYGRLTLTGGYHDVGGHGIGGVGIGKFLQNIAGTLVSPERGVLICSPILFLALLGLRTAWRSSPRLVRLFAVAGLAYLASQLWLIRFSGGDGFVGYRVCLESLVYASPLLVEAGRTGAIRAGRLGSWVLVLVSVAFFSAGAFSTGETIGFYDPWTSWAPLQLTDLYGPWRVVIGALVGAGAVFVSWWLWERVWVDRRSASVDTPESPETTVLPVA